MRIRGILIIFNLAFGEYTRHYNTRLSKNAMNIINKNIVHVTKILKLEDLKRI